MEYPIVLTTDENYIPYLLVTIQSIISNSSAGNNYSINILHDGLSQRSQNIVSELQTENIKINFTDVNQYIEKYKPILNSKGAFSQTIYYRLLIPELFSQCKKVLFLDCDLVVNIDIAKFFEIDLKDNYLGAVSDIGLLNEGRYTQRIGIDRNKYFNSGVLLFNIDKFKEIDLFSECIKLSEKYCRLEFHDQDLLNLFAKDNVLLLDYKYNFQWHVLFDSINDSANKEMIASYFEAKNNPYIVHYTTREKPWNTSGKEMTEYFWKYARNTLFYEKMLFQVTDKNIGVAKNLSKLELFKYKLKSRKNGKKQKYYMNKYNNLNALFKKFGVVK